MALAQLSWIRTVLAIVGALLTVFGVSAHESQAELFREDFNHPAGVSGSVAFDGHPLYTKPIPGPSTGGDATGTKHENALIVTNFDAIKNDQTGSSFFLYINTRCIDVNDFRGDIWGTLTPVPVIPNTSYVFSFYLTNRNNIRPAQVEPRINGVAIAPSVTAVGTWPGQQWQRFAFTWTAPTGTNVADLSLFNLQPKCGGNDFGIDSITFAPAVCGDGVVQPEMGEQCDDGNLNCCDGCDTFCQVE